MTEIPIKDLKELKDLFPEMKDYLPDPTETKEESVEASQYTMQEKSKMKLYVSRDKKQRAGKTVTLVQGHEGSDAQLEKILSKLKSLCSSGGSLKEGELIIQGDHVKKVMDYFIKDGYKNTKQKGG
ncbi:MAG: translation initiation factor [Bacteroidota bacterium]|nr:translation initiation factor [Bacteroidota bacterium]